MKNKLFYCFVAIILTVLVASYVVYNRYEYRNVGSSTIKVEKITGDVYIYDWHKGEWVPFKENK